MLFAFIDTNVILHYRPIAEIDWCKVCGEKDITIMMCMPVIDELDRKKFDARLGQRAKERIQELQQQTAIPVRPNVGFKIYHDPSEDAVADDASIAKLVAAYRDREHADVVVITEDWGMKTRCSALGVRTVTPPKEQRLADDETDDKKQIKKLQRELLEIKNKQPKVDLSFVPSSEVTQALTRPQLPGVAEQIEKLTRSIDPHGYNAPTGNQRQMYMDAVAKWLKNDHIIADESARTISLKIAVKNSGNAPANGVTVTIKFPDDVIKAICYEHYLDGERARPIERPPEYVFLSVPLPEPSRSVPQILSQGNIHVPLNGRVSKRVFNITIPVMPHGDPERIFSDFYLTFRTWEDVRPFVAEATIRTLEPASMKTLEIPVKARVVKG
jgi:hypothetical protein